MAGPLPFDRRRTAHDLSPFDHVALIAADVPVRARAASDAEAIATLSHTILRLGGDRGYPQAPWTAVVLADGRAGHVDARFVRSPIDYRAWFTRRDGRWQLTMFLAGD